MHQEYGPKLFSFSKIVVHEFHSDKVAPIANTVPTIIPVLSKNISQSKPLYVLRCLYAINSHRTSQEAGSRSSQQQ